MEGNRELIAGAARQAELHGFAGEWELIATAAGHRNAVALSKRGVGRINPTIAMGGARDLARTWGHQEAAARG